MEEIQLKADDPRVGNRAEGTWPKKDILERDYDSRKVIQVGLGNGLFYVCPPRKKIKAQLAGRALVAPAKAKSNDDNS